MRASPHLSLQCAINAAISRVILPMTLGEFLRKGNPNTSTSKRKISERFRIYLTRARWGCTVLLRWQNNITFSWWNRRRMPRLSIWSRTKMTCMKSTSRNLQQVQWASSSSTRWSLHLAGIWRNVNTRSKIGSALSQLREYLLIKRLCVAAMETLKRSFLTVRAPRWAIKRRVKMLTEEKVLLSQPSRQPLKSKDLRSSPRHRESLICLWLITHHSITRAPTFLTNNNTAILIPQVCLAPKRMTRIAISSCELIQIIRS